MEETVIIYNQKKQIDFKIDIKNWQGILYREFRAAFPLNMSSSKITYEVPMGVVEVGKDELKCPAGNVYNTDCKLTHPRAMVDWVNASDSQFGATISSSVIAFDYLDPIPDSTTKTLIQPILFVSRKSCHGEGNEYLQLGDHHFSFSLFIHEPGWENGFHDAKQEQNKLYTVLDPIPGKSKLLLEKQSFFNIKGGLTVITAIKKSEDDNDLIIRLVEMKGVNQKSDLEIFRPIKKLLKTNLIEEDQQETGQSGKVLKLDIGKNSIETYKLKF